MFDISYFNIQNKFFYSISDNIYRIVSIGCPISLRTAWNSFGTRIVRKERRNRKRVLCALIKSAAEEVAN